MHLKGATVATEVKITCPECKFSGTIEVEAVSPVAGDLTICGKCGEILAFNDDLTLEVTEARDPHGILSRAQHVIRIQIAFDLLIYRLNEGYNQ